MCFYRVCDFNIQPESTLRLVRDRGDMQIFVRTQYGKLFGLDIEARDSIYSIKARIHYRYGIHQDKQRLIFAGRELEDEFTFIDYNIEHESTLHMVRCCPSSDAPHVSTLHKKCRIAAAQCFGTKTKSEWVFECI